MNAARCRVRRQVRRRGRSDDGITLIEVMVAFVILIITVVPMAYLLTSAVAAADNTRQREAALQLADSWLEILSNSTPPTRSDGSILTNSPQTPTLPAGAIQPKSPLGGTAFTVTANYTDQSVNQAGQGQSDLCTNAQPPSPSHPGVIQLQVTVTWNHGQQSLTDTTNITYPRPGIQTQGFIAIQVNNQGANDVYGNPAATRLQSVPITVTSTTSSFNLTLYPDENGCAFAQVPVDSYNVSVGQPSSGTPHDFTGWNGSPPFVTASGATSQAYAAVPVTVTQEATESLTFDEGINTTVTYGGSSAIAGGVECPSAASLTCMTLGNGTSQASAAWGGNGAAWSATTLSGVTTLSQVACTSGGSSTCVGVGYGGSNGVVLTTSSDVNSGHVHGDTVPAGVTDISQVSCPSSNGCYAIGTTATGPVLLAGAVGQTGSNHDTWAIVAPPSTTFTSLTSLACPTTSTCELGEVGASGSTPGVLRLDGDPTTLATNSSWTPTFTLDNMPPVVTSIGKIVCPSTTVCLATATQNDSNGAFDPTLVSTTIAASPPSDWTVESNFPLGARSITGLSCATNSCVAIGSAPQSGTVKPAVWTGDLTPTPDDWAPASGVPGVSSLGAVTAVACGVPTNGDTADCLVTGSPSAQGAAASLILGTLTGGGWAWTTPSVGVSPPPLYYSGVACQSPGSGGSVCAAAASTATGPVIVTAGTPTGSWSVQTPSSLVGATVSGVPLETSPAGLTSWSTQVAAATGHANATSLPNVLYPLAGGYSIAAGDCSAEAGSSWEWSSFTAAPGGTATATVPLGLLPLQVVTPAGVPISGATVTLTAQCNSDQYAMPSSDANGFTRSAVPYGTYTYSVTVGGSTTPVPGVSINVQPNVVTVTTTGPPASAVSTYLPSASVVQS